MSTHADVHINQSVAILIDGNNIERGLQKLAGDKNALLDFDKMVPKLLDDRGLKRLIYFREGISISDKLAERLLKNFHGSVVPCHKSADIPLTIMATQIAPKVDTVIILSGDSDYVELVRHLKGEGVRVEIAAVQHTTAKILVDEVEHFTPITLDDCYILKVPGRSSSKSRTTTTAKRSSSKQSSSEVKSGEAKKTKATKSTTSRSSSSSNKTESGDSKADPKPKRVAKPKSTKAPSASRKPAPKKEDKEAAAKPSKRKSPATHSKSKRRPAAKSIKDLEKEAKKPVVKKKVDDWDDLSF